MSILKKLYTKEKNNYNYWRGKTEAFNMINIAFTDWWNGFDMHNNFIVDSLSKIIDFKVFDAPSSDKTKVDFVFCSIFSDNFLNFSCPLYEKHYKAVAELLVEKRKNKDF